MTTAKNLYPASPTLNALLQTLCEGIEIPQLKEQTDDKQAERLIEQIEIQNYPHSLLECTHQLEKQIGEDCVECQQQQYQTYKSRYLTSAKEKGYNHTHTLKAAFDYYSTLITQYRLTECDELLDAIYPACMERGSWSVYYMMVIQARAFLRFKQERYKESLDYFDMQIEIQGPNERIFENMALAYSRLNQFKEASTYYAQAILLICQKPTEQQEFSTLLMGLATVLDKVEDSLVALDESMRLLKLKYDQPHSLMAKTLGAMGDLHLRREDITTAEKCYAEAVTIFIETCGYETPLTAHAMNKHAKTLLSLGKKEQAVKVFNDALKVWANVDNESFSCNIVAEALTALSQEYSANKALAQVSPDAITTLEALQTKINASPLFNSDLNALCLLKFIYELCIIQGNIPKAVACCRIFKNRLSEIDPATLGELAVHHEKLLQETSYLLQIMERMP